MIAFIPNEGSHTWVLDFLLKIDFSPLESPSPPPTIAIWRVSDRKWWNGSSWDAAYSSGSHELSMTAHEQGNFFRDFDTNQSSFNLNDTYYARYTCTDPDCGVPVSKAVLLAGGAADAVTYLMNLYDLDSTTNRARLWNKDKDGFIKQWNTSDINGDPAVADITKRDPV